VGVDKQGEQELTLTLTLTLIGEPELTLTLILTPILTLIKTFFRHSIRVKIQKYRLITL